MHDTPVTAFPAIAREPEVSARSGSPRVLVLSQNYPTEAIPSRGLWVQRLVRSASASAHVTVIAPIPFAPPGLPVPDISRFRAVDHHRLVDGIHVWHPRTPAGLAYGLHPLDATLAYPFIRRLAVRLHARRPFDLIHAHFMYPDGVMAARLGRELGIPVVTTEHAFWHMWAHDNGRIWHQIQEALPDIHTVTAVSNAVRHDIDSLTAGTVRSAVLPNVVDDDVFALDPAPPVAYDPEQLLFVGLIRHVKGLDVLIEALSMVVAERPHMKLVIIGAAFQRGYRADELAARRLADRLGLDLNIRWRGEGTAQQVAAAMRRSSLVIVPSRRESFCSVAAEALACGTPVVATRCGGPEEILTPELGTLVPPEDSRALARGIMSTVAARTTFDAAVLSASSISRFGRAAAEQRLRDLYTAVLSPATHHTIDFTSQSLGGSAHSEIAPA